MQKNEFEKQVQQKMEELKLHPSDSVWQNIEGHLSKKKRPKLVWVLFPMIAVLLLAGYWLMNSKNTLTSEQKTNLSKSATKKDSFSDKDQSSTNISDKTNSSSATNSDLDYDKKNNLAINQIQKIRSSSFKGDEKKISSTETPVKTVAARPVEQTKNQNISPTLINVPKPAEEKTETMPGQINETDTTNNNQSVNNNSSPEKVIADNIKNEETKTAIPENKQLKVPNARSKKAWRWGLNFSVGISGVPNKFLGSLDKSFAAADALYSTSPPQNNFGLLPSKITSSGALIAGILVEKNISKRNTVVIGLNYKMFSTTNKVGEKDNSSQRYRLNNAVDNYHNFYHFVELPVSFKVEMNSKKLPLFWDAGLSISQLVSSNALQFNSSYVLYDRNNSLFNKSQVGFNTGFYVSLFSSKLASIQVGPHIYYGTTKVAEEGLYKNQHFTFIGLRSQILFKK